MTPWLVLAALVVGVALFVRWRSTPAVLGRPMAAARLAEGARMSSRPPGPSPMPATHYDAARGDHDLVAVTPLDLDTELQVLARSFGAASAQERPRIRARISMEELYTLLTFARRCAVLAAREKSADRCEDALSALAMIDETRVDPRDAMWAAAIVAWAVATTQDDRRAPFRRAAALATPGMAKILDRSATAKLSSWRMMAIETERGVGLVLSGGAKYEPTCDLTGAALRLARVLSQGKYVAHVEVASDLPEVWFAKERRGDAKKRLKRARACVLVTGQLREDVAKGPSMQRLLVWLVELPDPALAAALVQDAIGRSTEDDRFCVGFAEERLFGMLVGGSWAVGTAPHESPESMRALAETLRPLVREVKEIS